MKRFLSFALASLLALSSTACGAQPAPEAPSNADSNPTSTASSDEPIVIKFANYAVLEEGNRQFWEDIKTDFEKENPDIKIEWISAPYGEITQQVINMAGGGEHVDLIFGEIDWTPTFESAGLTCPVKEIMGEDYLADFYPNVLEAHMIDGEVYSLPMYVGPYVLYYNTDLFKQAGLDPDAPPTTYDEMMEAAAALSKLTDSDGNPVYPFGQATASVPVSGASLTSMVFNFGGHVLDEKGNLDIQNPGFHDAMAFLDKVDEMGYMPQNTKLKDLRNLFALGRLAMYYDQSWGFAGIRAINPDAGEFTATAKPLVGGSGKGESILQAHCLLMCNNGPEKAAAVRRLVEFLITTERLSYRMSNETLAYPAKKEMAHAVDDCKILAGALGSAENTKSQVFLPQTSDLYLELCGLAQAITVGEEDVNSAIASFEKTASALLNE